MYYVFAGLIRDREVGGSNPLAPTNNSNNLAFHRRQIKTPRSSAKLSRSPARTINSASNASDL